MQLKKIILFLLTILLPFYCFSQKYTVSGGTGEPYAYGEDLVGTGIDKVYLLNTLTGSRISFSSSSPSIKIYRYQQSLANKQPVPDADINESSTGGQTIYTISNLWDGWGYYIEGSSIGVIWIIDYNQHKSILNSISFSEGDDKCELLKLLIDKSDSDFIFYTTSGIRREIKPKYTIEYNTQKWENNAFSDEKVKLTNLDIGTEYIVDAPLADTRFTLYNPLAEKFGISNYKIESDLYQAVATQAHIVTEKGDNSGSNISEAESSDLSGAAPLDIHFYGHGNEPVAYFYTWNIYNLKNLDNAIIRYTDKDFPYRFEESGDYKVVLEVADRSSYCADTVSVTFKITESFLDQPNFFSPGDSPGVNDEFRVAYKSLIRFKCTIFNRWGVKLYEWTDPAKGWDGRYKGSYVKPGVYFYVIDAEGSDGIKYKRAGDINILRSK